LQYYRLQKISEGSISLSGISPSGLDGPTEVGSGIVRENKIPFSRLIDLVNIAFGTEFKEGDQLFFDQIIEAALLQESVQQAVRANPKDKFELVFESLIQAFFIERMDQNVDIFARYMNDSAFQSVVKNWLADRVYERIKEIDPDT
jgi:type I restriction enzyme, R subunit